MTISRVNRGLVTGSLTALFCWLAIQPFAAGQSRLYDTNLIVVRVGDGTQTLSSSGNSVFLDQFTTNGAYVSTLALPDTGTSAVVLSGNSFVDGFLTRSADRRLVSLAVYQADPRTSTASVFSRQHRSDICHDVGFWKCNLAVCCYRWNKQLLGSGLSRRRRVPWQL
jgi:hypothetical protein